MFWEPADIVIYIWGKGVVLKEKSLVAYHSETKKIIAVGTAAEEHRFEENVNVESPLRQGVVEDYTVAVALFSQLLQKALGKKTFPKPRIAICMPPNLTEVEKKVITDVMYGAGGREFFIFDIPMKQFVEELPEKSPKLCQKYKIVIGITKDEPKEYLQEKLKSALQYAEEQKIPWSDVSSLWESLVIQKETSNPPGAMQGTITTDSSGLED